MEKTRITFNRLLALTKYPPSYTLKTVREEKYEGWQWWRRGEVREIVEDETYYLEFQVEGKMVNTFTELMAKIIGNGFTPQFPIKPDSEPISIGRGEDGVASIFTLKYIDIDHDRKVIMIDVTHSW